MVSGRRTAAGLVEDLLIKLCTPMQPGPGYLLIRRCPGATAMASGRVYTWALPRLAMSRGTIGFPCFKLGPSFLAGLCLSARSQARSGLHSAAVIIEDEQTDHRRKIVVLAFAAFAVDGCNELAYP